MLQRNVLARSISTIQDATGLKVIDSRGNPTVEVDIATKDGFFRAMMASGAPQASTKHLN